MSQNLTPNEVILLEYIKLGYTNDDIAKKLHKATQTVNNQTSCIYSKIGARNRSHAVYLAILKNIISINSMLVVALFSTPMDMDMKRGDRRIRRKMIIQAQFNQNTVNLYYWPMEFSKLSFKYGDQPINARKAG